MWVCVGGEAVKNKVWQLPWFRLCHGLALHIQDMSWARILKRRLVGHAPAFVSLTRLSRVGVRTPLHTCNLSRMAPR